MVPTFSLGAAAFSPHRMLRCRDPARAPPPHAYFPPDPSSLCPRFIPVVRPLPTQKCSLAFHGFHLFPLGPAQPHSHLYRLQGPRPAIPVGPAPLCLPTSTHPPHSGPGPAPAASSPARGCRRHQQKQEQPSCPAAGRRHLGPSQQPARGSEPGTSHRVCACACACAATPVRFWGPMSARPPPTLRAPPLRDVTITGVSRPAALWRHTDLGPARRFLPPPPPSAPVKGRGIAMGRGVAMKRGQESKPALVGAGGAGPGGMSGKRQNQAWRGRTR